MVINGRTLFVVASSEPFRYLPSQNGVLTRRSAEDLLVAETSSRGAGAVGLEVACRFRMRPNTNTKRSDRTEYTSCLLRTPYQRDGAT